MLARSDEVEVSTQLLERLTAARARTDQLFDVVKPDSLYERPIPERHRIIFYLGHLEAFDWNLLRGWMLDLKSFHPEFDRLFAFGIDPVGGGLPSDQPGDWPSIGEVRNFAGRIRETLDRELRSLSRSANTNGKFAPSLLLNVAIEHRLMHAETLTYMLHQLAFERKVAQPRVPELVLAPVKPGMIDIPTGRATLGLSRSDASFGWDNEYEANVVDVPAFAIDQYKVTNRQFLDFIDAGGYDNPACWKESDWAWRTEHNINHPVFWQRTRDRWFYRTMFQQIPLPLDWPVYVSHAEADAFARWAGKELPTEAQWHRAAYGSPEGVDRSYPWGDQRPGPKLGNFDFQRWDPAPVNAHPIGESAFGVADLLGNGWEWTSSVFAPFAGFKPFPFYPGYSADFFDGKHYVLKGGSPRTAACMLRRSFRNWFQPHYQYVYAGIRCVQT
ncbi:MAG TPA: SUMF1/EgtB/PvdO family nonheme iron enzyme [Terriglobales bacterium]|nr:SUMF1/EgtB/PvdO family nonheme iron enzyme [Terriglobales bacterium]